MIDKVESPPAELSVQLELSAQYSLSNGAEGEALCLAFDSFHGVNLAGAVFADGVLQEVAFKDCFLDGANFTSAMANGMKLDGSSLVGSIFVDTQLEGATFINSVLNRIDMRECRIEEADFTSAKLNDGTVSHCSGFSSKFVNADLTNANLSHSGFHGANFVGAIMNDADLTGAMFDDYTLFAPATPVKVVRADFILINRQRIERAEVYSALEKLRVSSMLRIKALNLGLSTALLSPDPE
jgi:uncharacterized protein YjbI with pentapeptide repeats